jgi:hypothetical protein
MQARNFAAFGDVADLGLVDLAAEALVVALEAPTDTAASATQTAPRTAAVLNPLLLMKSSPWPVTATVTSEALQSVPPVGNRASVT